MRQEEAGGAEGNRGNCDWDLRCGKTGTLWWEGREDKFVRKGNFSCLICGIAFSGICHLNFELSFLYKAVNGLCALS